MLKKVVILGPESTGKSTLCRELAAHYQTLWCPEYARQYLLEHGTKYSYGSLLTIAKGQLALEDEYSQLVSKAALPNTPPDSHRNPNSQFPNSQFPNSQFPNSPLLFIDTDMQVMKVWCQYVFNDSHTWILNQIAERRYDLYLLCNPDLPWVKDELREYPNERPRRELYHIYRDLMIHQQTPWADISGSYAERLRQGIVATDALMGGAH